MNTEPAITIASVTALVAALITLLVAFGVDISTDQKAAIMGVVTIGAPIVAGLLIRRKVSPA